MVPRGDELFVLVVTHVLLGRRSAGDRISTVNPSAEIDELASIGTERKAGQIVEPSDFERLAADRASNGDHGQLVPLVEGLGDSALGAGAAGVDGVVDVLSDLAGSEADFSALAPFL